MEAQKNVKLNISLIAFIFTAIIIVFSSGAYAASVPSASGQIDSYDGAILRKSSSTDSAVLCVLSDDTKITIHKEVFKSKTSTAKTKKWYYVTANGTKGYVRADLVDNISYGSVKGTTSADVIYRKGAGTEMKQSGILETGATVTIVLKAKSVYSTRGSSSTWYKVKVDNKYYYVCSGSVKLIDKTATQARRSDSNVAYDQNMTDKEFEKYLTDEGFPESYKKKLRKLHAVHPNWVFVGYKTNISWKTALSKQTSGSTSLVSGSLPTSYRDGTRQYEPGWYKAGSKVVAYYMDPRNFLNEDKIFMFEDLSYNSECQTASVVRAILSSTKLPGCGFTAKIFVKAGKANDISPVFLASRARQETGSGGAAVNGTRILGKKVYNPFNIGAFGGTNPLYNGLVYAYGKGWTTPTKAVKGGAKQLAKNYINRGQNTTYYQRFNVRNGKNKVGTHQYMTNITAPYTEAGSTKTSYSRYGILNKPLVFEIPIYDSMPKSTKLP